TAFNEYAVKAFEVNALDYLMKPIRRERFAKAMEKIRHSLEEKPRRQVFIKDGEKYYFIQLEDIGIIESHGNYSSLRFSGKKVLLKRSLRQWEEMLDSNIFLRINRTQLINTRYISETRKSSKNKLELIMKTGEVLEVSERQSARLRSLNTGLSL
ncbi:MAG TPA: LytTR family DNA-binding domain-containing protein, partial [Chitinophagaceae bacterium]|nr:LytTR family DNA-binding domain-containing protein [Chitinophagaceae bacterium]